MTFPIENELVHQKNTILEAINEGRYEEAALLIAFSEELWRVCDYGYKTNELKQRILDSLRENINSAEHHKTAAKNNRCPD